MISPKRLARAPLDLVHYAVERRNDPLLPPPWLHSVGGPDHRRTGQEFLGHFVKLGGLRPTDRVLDIGSGSGRMAAPLTNYLTTGTYDGIEIVKRSVAWCQRAYAPQASFRFHHAGIFNRYYNPRGIPAVDYRFPFPDRSFDFVFLTSVFTHMLAADVAHYLREIRRVLADGRVLMTAFLLNDRPQPNPKRIFRYDAGGCFSDVPVVPERAIAYEEATLVRMIEAAGLKVIAIHYGRWRGTEGPSIQDILVVE